MDFIHAMTVADLAEGFAIELEDPKKTTKILIRKVIQWAVQSARGDPWPETFN
jgi:hypothetical protein